MSEVRQGRKDPQESITVSICAMAPCSPGLPVPVWRPVPVRQDTEEMRRSARGKWPSARGRRRMSPRNGRSPGR